MAILYAAGTIPGPTQGTSAAFHRPWVRGAIYSVVNYVPTFSDVKGFHVMSDQERTTGFTYAVILGGYLFNRTEIYKYTTSWTLIKTLPEREARREIVVLRFDDRDEIYIDQLLEMTIPVSERTLSDTNFRVNGASNSSSASELIFTDNPNDFLLGAKVADVTVTGEETVDPEFTDMIAWMNSAKNTEGSFGIVDKTQAMKAVALTGLPAQTAGEEAFFYINAYNVANGDASVEKDGSFPFPAGTVVAIPDSKGDVPFAIKMGV